MRVKRLGQAASLVLLLGFTAVTATQTWAALQANPFAQHLVSPAQLQRGIDQALQRFATPELLEERLSAAITADDRESALLYRDIAQNRGVLLSPQLLADLDAYLTRKEAFLTRTTDCLACAWDADACENLTQMLTCKGPILFTPIDDVAVLSGAGVDAMRGEDVDKLDVSLALVGLGATALVVFTGGTSYTLKIGAGAIKAAKRMGLLSLPMQRSLRAASDIPITWNKLDNVLLRKAPLDEAVDLTRLAPLADMASDLARMERATTASDALHLLKYADTAAELKTTARVAESLGPEARGAFEILGKSRVMRIALRLSDEVLAAMTGMLLFFGQIGTLMGSLLGRLVFGKLRRSLR